MAEYRPKKNTIYTLPENVYMMMIFTVRDYQRMKEELQSNRPIPRSYTLEINAIEKALEDLPEEYRKDIWDNIVDNRKLPARNKTYTLMKCRFLYQIARYTGRI